MTVQITINGGNAAEAIEEFATLSAAFIGAPAATPAPEEKPKRQRNATPVKEEKPAKEEESEETGADTGSDDGEDIPSAVDLRAKAQELGQDAANKPKIKALLEKYEAKNITALGDDQRAAFMKDLEALG